MKTQATNPKKTNTKKEVATTIPMISRATIWQVPDVCKYLGISRRTFYTMKTTEKFGVIELECSSTKALYYSAWEIVEWIAAGCPDRKKWQAMKGNKRFKVC